MLDRAFDGLFAADSFRAFMLGDDQVYPVGTRGAARFCRRFLVAAEDHAAGPADEQRQPGADDA